MTEHVGTGDEADGGLSARAGDAALVHRVFEQLPLILAVVEGPELRITAATGTYRQFTGRPDVVGALLTEAFPEVIGQQVFPAFERVYATGVPEFQRDFRLQFTRPDTGEQTECFFDFSLTALTGADGERTGVIMSVVDQTERVRERRAAQQQANVAERRYAAARDVIDSLQRELLPAGVPVLPQVRIAASYLLADTETAAGGDWFDAQVLPDGRVALVVGDVVGHGVTASATMGQLRILLHDRLATNPDILAALTGLDTAAAAIPAARAATVCVVVLDPRTGALEYCTAGHPPPLLLSATGGDGRFLPGTGGGPIGVGGVFGADTVGKDRLVEGELVLLYTDGILERPGRELAASTVELAQAAADIAADRALRGDTDSAVERVCTQTLELLVRLTGHTDDITLLAAQLAPAAPELSCTLAAAPESLAQVRAGLDEWLHTAHAGAADVEALRHAVVELATNVIDHAHIDSAEHHTYTVTGVITGTGEVRLQVADHGRWREPRPSPDRGRGLQVTADLVDTLRVEHDDRGTTVTVHHRLTRPARLLTAGVQHFGAPIARPVQADPLLVLDQPSAAGARVRIDGPLDTTGVEAVDREIRFAGSTGTRPLTVDLTGITHLASAGVALLHRLTALHRDNGTPLVLYAPTGSTADMILSLVDLPHRTDDPDSGHTDPDIRPDGPSGDRTT